MFLQKISNIMSQTLFYNFKVIALFPKSIFNAFLNQRISLSWKETLSMKKACIHIENDLQY